MGEAAPPAFAPRGEAANVFATENAVVAARVLIACRAGHFQSRLIEYSQTRKRAGGKAWKVTR